MELTEIEQKFGYTQTDFNGIDDFENMTAILKILVLLAFAVGGYITTCFFMILPGV